MKSKHEYKTAFEIAHQQNLENSQVSKRVADKAMALSKDEHDKGDFIDDSEQWENGELGQDEEFVEKADFTEADFKKVVSEMFEHDRDGFAPDEGVGV